MRKQLFAFTLAEVLIVLGIIGIIASLTIPSLMNSVADMQYKTAYKKAYSAASQAWLSVYGTNEATVCTDWYDGECNKNNFKIFKSKFKIAKDCGNDTASCWDMNGEKSWDGNFPTTDALSFIDSSGMAWSKLYNTETSDPSLLVDTNGFKGPNQYGKDRAVFELRYYYDGSHPTNFSGKFSVGLIADCPTGTGVDDIVEETNRCPSMAKHPCYYTSWITGAK